MSKTESALADVSRIRKQHGKEPMCCGCFIEGHPGDGWMQPPDPPSCCGEPDEDVGILLDGIDAELRRLAAVEAERDALRTQCETLSLRIGTEQMRLTACGVVAMADTPESASLAREMAPAYWSNSCADVARRVDECIALRSELSAAKARVEALSKDLADANETADWHKRRTSLLQILQRTMQEPERTIVCDVLANGHLLQGPDGRPDKQRYATQPLTRPAVPDDMGYDSIDGDGPVGMALEWLNAALKCKSYEWDPDQRECAEGSLKDAAEWMRRLVAAFGRIPAAPQPD